MDLMPRKRLTTMVVKEQTHQKGSGWAGAIAE
jgi:hypothetical protein